jgi:predicted TIM-barrel fold metal-dependent hydrolase
MERIDTHQHLWELDKLLLPWLPESGPLAESHPPLRYEAESAGLGISQTIYMEVDVLPEQRVVEASYVFALCEDASCPMAGAVIGGDPASPDFAGYLNTTDHPARKGVRQVLHGGLAPGYCLRPEFQRGLELLAEKDLLFDFCLRPDELADAAVCARNFPESRFVLDHCGNAPIHGSEAEISRWKAGIEAVANCPNVQVKLSGIVAQCTPDRPLTEQLAPFIGFTLAAFGPERALWASDWPVCKNGASLSEWVATIDMLLSHLPLNGREAVFAENARRLYRLDAPTENRKP